MNKISIFIALFASGMTLFVSVFVLVKDWRDQVMRYLAAFCIAGMGIIFTMFLTYAFPDYFDLTRLNKITQLSTLMTFSIIFILSFIFPQREIEFPFWKSALIILPALAAGLAVVFTDITITRAYFKDGEFIRDYNKEFPGYTIYAGLAFAYILSTLGKFVRKYITTKEYIYRLQMRYLFVGSSVAITVASVFSIIMPRFFNYSDMYVIGPAAAALIIIAALFYTVIAHNLLDITTVIHKTFVYAVISTLILLPIFGILWAYDRHFLITADVPYYLVAMVVIVIFILFSVYIQPAIDRTFKRKQYAFGSIVDSFVLEMEGVRDLQSVIQRTVNILREGLSLRRVFFILLNDMTRKYELFYFKGDQPQFKLEPIERNASIIRWFVRNQEILQMSRVYIDKSLSEIKDEISSFFNDNGVQLMLPIYYERRLIGLLCLGVKETLSGYHTDELEKLRFFHSKSNDFISSALTYQKAVKDQLVARTIDLSSQILKDAVPPSLPNIGPIKFGAFIIPKYAEGSDYFDFIRPGEQGVGILATDISGIGVNSALYSVMLRSAFQASINEAPSTSTVAQNLNRALWNYTRGQGGLVTAMYLYYDIKSMRLMYTNAGYPGLELFRIEKNNFDTLDTEGIPLGYDADSAYGIGRTDMVRGDIGVLYSKTLTTSRNHKGEDLGLLRLRSIVMENRTRSAAEIAAQIKSAFDTLMGLSTPDSDVIVIVFKIM